MSPEEALHAVELSVRLDGIASVARALRTTPYRIDKILKTQEIDAATVAVIEEIDAERRRHSDRVMAQELLGNA